MAVEYVWQCIKCGELTVVKRSPDHCTVPPEKCKVCGHERLKKVYQATPHVGSKGKGSWGRK